MLCPNCYQVWRNLCSKHQNRFKTKIVLLFYELIESATRNDITVRITIVNIIRTALSDGSATVREAAAYLLMYSKML
ncbi:BEM_HP_G0080770.mRNA.1.CDS.1 [Saccharomyces cerevisiae]|nr:BEM_HP_G0080770.mRNA.1.CDS.1 [Saccharomyces cerevisiae]CAI6992464.1 BEM_HP_G0080770.mRNA.1.CDS.1 [Saccharomyces cerevisiae]